MGTGQASSRRKCKEQWATMTEANKERNRINALKYYYRKKYPGIDLDIVVRKSKTA